MVSLPQSSKKGKPAKMVFPPVDFLRVLRPRLHFIYDFQRSGLPGSHIQGENMIGHGSAGFPSAVASLHISTPFKRNFHTGVSS